jgi:hypothetical protein
LRLLAVRTEVLVEENDMKDAFLELRELGSEKGDAGEVIGTKKLNGLDEEMGAVGGAEKGGRYDVGELTPADLGDEGDEAKGKREGLGITIGGGGCVASRLEGTLGRADDGADLWDGRVRMESRERRRAGGRGSGEVGTGKCQVEGGMGCCLLV